MFAKWRLNWEPGTRFEYHPTSAHWVLAELIARADGVEHTDAIRRRVLEPLGLTRLALGVPVDQQRDIAPLVHTGEVATPEEFQAVLGVPAIDLGEVTEAALMGFNEPDALAVGVPGGGAVSTAADLALLYQALLHNPGELWDPKWLTIATSDVRNTFEDAMAGGIKTNRTIGLVVAGGDGLGARRGFGHGNSAGTFGHDGAGGQLAWADPESGLSFVYLTNGLDRHLIRQWRRNISIGSKGAAVGLSA
jgi:CubicO group peptidase (beta-lactamase class C family)